MSSGLERLFNQDGSVHHAALICGDIERIQTIIRKFIEEELRVQISNNPDVYIQVHDSFGVEDGKKLGSYASKKAFGERKIFVAVFNSMTVEAQNGLLKLFEEPTENTHFFLATHKVEGVLPTLRSRMVYCELEADMTGENSETENVKVFIESDKGERIALLKDMISEKDKAKAQSFLNALEIEIASKAELDQQATEAILDAKKYLFDRSSSMKLLLEHVALSLPKY